MTFWQQLLLAQASSTLHAILRTYGAKYFTPDELTATDVVFDALIELPQRIHVAASLPPAHRTMNS